MSTSVNYSGRMVDVLIFQGWREPGKGSAQVCIEFGTDGGSVVTGIMKLIQMFAIRLLTEEGSSYKNPTFGTSFMTNLRTSTIRTEAELRATFAEAVADIKSQFLEEYEARTESGETVPDDEQLDSVTLKSFEFLPDGIDLSLYIVSAAGESRDVILPVSVAIR